MVTPRPISTGIKAWGILQGTVPHKVQRAHDFAFKLWHALTICQLRGAIRQWHVCMKIDITVQLQQAQVEMLRLRQEIAKADARNRELESKETSPIRDVTKATNLVIKPSNLNMNSKVASSLQGDSTPATNLGDNPKEVEGEGDKPYFDIDCTPDTYTGVMPRKFKVDSIEL